MRSKVTIVMHQLRELMKAYDRYSRAVSGQTSEVGVDAAFEITLNSIRAHWTDSLDELMRNVAGSADDGRLGQAIPPRVLTYETAALSELRVESEFLRWFYNLYLESSRAADHCPSTTEEFLARLRSLHEAAKRELSASRTLGRREKKRRKRHIGKAVASMTIGAGCFIANAHLPEFWKWSYGTGAGALLSAFRDLVRE